MLKKAMIAVILLSGIFIAAQPGVTLSGKHIVELKKAGISDKTIQVIVEEKVVETAALSVDDIVNIKKAGVSEETLRMLIKESSYLLLLRIRLLLWFLFSQLVGRIVNESLSTTDRLVDRQPGTYRTT